MADITVTAANVLRQGNSNVETGIAGATLTAGQMVYKAASDSKWKLADCDSATAEVKGANGVGMALHASLNGQPVTVLQSGDVALGAILTAGTPYYLSETPGGIRTTPDTGDFIVFLGLASTTSILAFRPIVPSVTLP